MDGKELDNQTIEGYVPDHVPGNRAKYDHVPSHLGMDDSIPSNLARNDYVPGNRAMDDSELGNPAIVPEFLVKGLIASVRLESRRVLE